jgi:hypothetical protein
VCAENIAEVRVKSLMRSGRLKNDEDERSTLRWLLKEISKTERITGGSESCSPAATIFARLNLRALLPELLKWKALPP